MNEGYIRLYRKFQNWEWYTDVNACHLFQHCILSANFTDKNWRGIDVKRGSFLTSREKLSQETGLSEQQIRTAINKLIKTNELTKSTTSKYTVLTVLNYDKYQFSNQDNNQQSTDKTTNEQPTSNQQVTTTNNEKNKKKEKNKDKRVYGELKNVLLTDEEFEKLKEKKLLSIIDDLSLYIPNKKGVAYKDHYAVILKWSKTESKPQINQEFKTDEEEMSEEERNKLIEKIKNRSETK